MKRTTVLSISAVLALTSVIATVGCSDDAEDSAAKRTAAYAKCIQGTPLQKFESCSDEQCTTRSCEDKCTPEDNEFFRACDEKCQVDSGCKADQKACDETEARCDEEADKAASN